MIEALQLIQFRVRMLQNLHHSPETGVLFVSPRQFQIVVARDQQQRRHIVPYMKQRSHVINDQLVFFDATLGTNC